MVIRNENRDSVTWALAAVYISFSLYHSRHNTFADVCGVVNPGRHSTNVTRLVHSMSRVNVEDNNSGFCRGIVSELYSAINGKSTVCCEL